MKKLLCLFALVFFLGFGVHAQATYLNSTDAIHSLKEARVNLEQVSLASTVGSNHTKVMLQSFALNGMIEAVKEYGNSESTFESYFSQTEFTSPRIKPADLLATKSLIKSLIASEED